MLTKSDSFFYRFIKKELSKLSEITVPFISSSIWLSSDGFIFDHSFFLRCHLLFLQCSLMFSSPVHSAFFFIKAVQSTRSTLILHSVFQYLMCLQNQYNPHHTHYLFRQSMCADFVSTNPFFSLQSSLSLQSQGCRYR